MNMHVVDDDDDDNNVDDDDNDGDDDDGDGDANDDYADDCMLALTTPAMTQTATPQLKLTDESKVTAW